MVWLVAVLAVSIGACVLVRWRLDVMSRAGDHRTAEERLDDLIRQYDHYRLSDDRYRWMNTEDVDLGDRR